ncbi:mucin-associated surface protein [Arthrobacter sp. D1-17]
MNPFARLGSALPVRASAALAVGLLSLGLVACGGTAPELETGAASQLQQHVLAITEAAAGNDPAKALKSLDQLSSQLDTAAAAGQVSFKRHQSITAAIDSVKTGLTAAQAAKKSAAAAAAKASAAKAAAEAAKHSPPPVTTPVAVAPAPAPAPVPAPKTDDKSGGGSDNGNSNGDEDKDNDKGSGDKRD